MAYLGVWFILTALTMLLFTWLSWWGVLALGVLLLVGGVIAER